MKILLDECMPPKASRLLVAMLQLRKPPIEGRLLQDRFEKGTWDGDWAGKLAEEGGWCVITCDCKPPKGQTAKSKGPPLNLILPMRGITGFFLAGKIASLTGFEKIRAVLCVFEELWNYATTGLPGARYRVLTSGSGYRIAKWPSSASALPGVLPPPAPPSPPGKSVDTE